MRVTVLRFMLCICILLCGSMRAFAAAQERDTHLEQLRAQRGEAYASNYRAQLEAFDALPAPADIVFFGDSLTANGNWQELSMQLHIVNLGIPNETIAGLSCRVDQVVRLQPKALFLLIGINDLSVTLRPAVYKDYEAFLDCLTQALPETVIYVQTLLPVRDDIRPIMSNRTLRLVNTRIVQMAETRKLICIDTFNPLCDPADERLWRDSHVDGLHLNQTGYARWRETLRPYVAAVEYAVRPHRCPCD